MLPLSDPLTQNILRYYDYLRTTASTPKFWLPSGKSVFGNYSIIPDRHLSDREVFNIVRGTSETLWPHLFRETVASDIVRQDNSIQGAEKARLGRHENRFQYLQRFAKDVIKRGGLRISLASRVDLIATNSEIRIYQFPVQLSLVYL